MNVLILVSVAGLFLAILLGAFGVYRTTRKTRAQMLRERLETARKTVYADEGEEISILQDMEMSSIPILNAILNQSRWARRLNLLLIQGDMNMKLGRFVLIMLLLAAVGAFAASRLLPHWAGMPLTAALLGSLPVVWALRKKQQRIKKFELQFPDALDILTSALKSGLALTGAVQVVSEESPDPVSKEFTILFEENRLGVDMREALNNLSSRVDSTELRLFVIAVLLQRETGGNLAEILTNTANVIRERIRILGDVRTLTAQARLSGLILSVLPLALAVFVIVTAPDYMRTLVDDPVGRYLIVIALVLQVVGFLAMRRIANIKV